MREKKNVLPRLHLVHKPNDFKKTWSSISLIIIEGITLIRIPMLLKSHSHEMQHVGNSDRSSNWLSMASYVCWLMHLNTLDRSTINHKTIVAHNVTSMIVLSTVNDTGPWKSSSFTPYLYTISIHTPRSYTILLS